MAGTVTVEQCNAALGACNALIVGSKTAGQRKHWQAMEERWKAKLKEIEDAG